MIHRHVEDPPRVGGEGEGLAGDPRWGCPARASTVGLAPGEA
jgi:hypothetical protein